MLVKMCLLIISQKKDSSRNDWSFLLEVHTLILYFFYGSFRNASFFLFILQSVRPPMLRANKLERKYSIGTILASLSKAECSLIQQNYYLFDYYDEVLKDIGKNKDIDFEKRIRTLGEIKKIWQRPKKQKKHHENLTNQKTRQAL